MSQGMCEVRSAKCEVLSSGINSFHGDMGLLDLAPRTSHLAPARRALP